MANEFMHGNNVSKPMAAPTAKTRNVTQEELRLITSDSSISQAVALEKKASATGVLMRLNSCRNSS